MFVKYLNGRKKTNDLAIIALLIVAAIVLKYNKTLSFHNGLLMLVFVPLIFLISCNNSLFSKLSNLKFLVFLGEISFGVYILQKPIFMAIKGVFTALNWHNQFYSFTFL